MKWVLMNQDHIFYFMILMVNSLFGLLLAEWPLLSDRPICPDADSWISAYQTPAHEKAVRATRARTAISKQARQHQPT